MLIASLYAQMWRYAYDIVGAGGRVERWHVTLKSGAREDTPMARYAVTKPGTKLGQAVQVDEIVGAECANESEPYILFKVITTHPALVSPYS